MPPPRTIVLPGGRRLTYDDVGDPHGQPVIYLHGTPDSRLARHPDDRLATRAGVRLLAVDRPGYGGTTPASPATGANAEDLAVLLDGLGLPTAVLLAWSGGALGAIQAAAAPSLADRLTGVVLVAGLVPADAYTDPQVRASAANRVDLAELAGSMPVPDLAQAVAPLLAPYPCDLALARDHQREQRTPADQRALEQIPGAVDQMAEALVEAVRHGLAGVEADIGAQVDPLGELVLRRVGAPVRLVYGSADVVTPPPFGWWYAQHIPRAELDVIEGAGHYLPFTHWRETLDRLGSPDG